MDFTQFRAIFGVEQYLEAERKETLKNKERNTNMFGSYTRSYDAEPFCSTFQKSGKIRKIHYKLIFKYITKYFPKIANIIPKTIKKK